ncbi:hypothetical protein OK344_09550 [Kaistella sp. BT6-1-3]|uniref:Uncharacterized protein n=1 Tax=Kaistella yananensis TaxID=2989820 RepID=A0ABT3JNU3_9FLAO|nr:hypothetical protein [Kaistella yananensis]MCW4452453.1 hypothetical protein [Kaistella yananensis]
MLFQGSSAYPKPSFHNPKTHQYENDIYLLSSLKSEEPEGSHHHQSPVPSGDKRTPTLLTAVRG